ncbi:ABC transporter substrate-binding protein [Aerococcus urinae]|uniref:ABC transporter substrate-binding protein n=3 Tax=Lactobacillales TaxID=186826 RepID=A0A0X8FDA5_9LACT|nr:ABC transporter substrate-binding protein [Aerococcus urinae]AMB95029.1 branched-chain amino acid ABC transporter substrate-binding protein [Aerococcus urinae]MCY3031736.1 ABC transporter substrate-binding protein [Aerococcus urinae]MCY3037269.1 ABC transporter substrate-binding protein [Aerococcus urinae]MCY3043783.1 ABC transporter substrate-binding protein [Aerococcus urinae]MCY3046572.1 ABC transporter substrate-binding protein [Aerococcus urinae]
MKKKMKKLAALFGTALMLGACGSMTETAKNDSANSDVVKIGGNWSLSGQYSAYGTPHDNGVKVAVKNLNDNGGVLGKKVEYVSADNKSDNAESTSQATRLVEQEGVNVLVGSDTTGNCEAQIPVAQQFKVPMVAPAATGNGLTLDDSGNLYDYVFRTCFEDAYQSKELGKYAAQKGWKKVAVLKDNSSDYGQNVANDFKASFEEHGGQVVGEESYTSGDTDFKALLTNLKQNSPDVVFIAGYYQEGGLIIKQLREMGVNAAVLGPDGFGNQKLIDLAGPENAHDVFFVTHFSHNEDSPENVKEFIKKYEDAYGTSPDHFAALAYDATNLIAQAMEKAGSTDSEAVQKALAETKDFQGVTGKFSFDKDHNPVKEVFVQELQGGQVVDTEVVK